MSVLKHVLEIYLENAQAFDEIWMLMACSPLIRARDYINASQLLDSTKGDKALLAVAEYPVPIQWAFRISDKEGVLQPVQPGAFAIRSQDLEKSYFDAGAFSAFPVDQVLGSEGAGADNAFIGFPLEKDQVVDIDEEADWKLAEALYRSRRLSNSQ